MTRSVSRIVHVRIRPHSNTQINSSIEQPSVLFKTKKNGISKQSFPNSLTIKKPYRYSDRTSPLRCNHTSSATNTSDRNVIENQQRDHGQGLSYDHHRNKEKKKISHRSCVIVSLVAVTIMIIILVLSVTLGILLGQKSSSTNRVAFLRWNPSGITIAGLGSGGNYSNHLYGPYGFTWDSNHTLYIVEIDFNRVTKWTPGAPRGTLVAGQANGMITNASNGFQYPVDIFLESNGDMYITDRMNSRLQFWANGASVGTTVAGAGSTGGIVLGGPSAIVRDPSTGEFYISTSNQGQIISYPSGAIVAGGNTSGNTITQLKSPIGLTYDDYKKALIISNYGGHSLVQWLLGAKHWTPINGLAGITGASSSLLDGPIGVTIDPMGNIYCADSNNHRVQLILNGQSEAITIAGVTGMTGSNSTRFNLPYWVKLDNQLNLYVADKLNFRIQKFLRY